MKININLSIPAIGEKYDVLVPTFLTVGEIIPLLANAVEEMSNKNYISSNREILCSKDTNQILLPKKTFEDYQIKNGDCIVMI